jgi:hypothetical protein
MASGGESSGVGRDLLATWLACAGAVARRVGAGLDPLLRIVGGRAVVEDRSTTPGSLPAAEGSPQTAYGEAKYYLGPQRGQPSIHHLLRYLDREPGELPRACGEDRLVLLARDPWCVFAYWEVTDATRARARGQLGVEAAGARPVLRLYDVTFITFTGGNAWQAVDVDIAPDTGSRYLDVSRPAASYLAEIGLRTPAGRFLPLARSNTATTPRATPSPDHRVRWDGLGPPPAGLSLPRSGNGLATTDDAPAPTDPRMPSRQSDARARRPPAR